MFFSWDVTVSADTAEASPKTQVLKLSKGVIVDLPITFPAGCAGMVKVRLFHRESQLIPLSRDEWVTGEFDTVPTERWFELKSSPYQLKFVGCSPGTSYDHKITVRAAVLPKSVAAPMLLLSELVMLFRRFFRM